MFITWEVQETSPTTCLGWLIKSQEHCHHSPLQQVWKMQLQSATLVALNGSRNPESSKWNFFWSQNSSHLHLKMLQWNHMTPSSECFMWRFLEVAFTSALCGFLSLLWWQKHRNASKRARPLQGTPAVCSNRENSSSDKHVSSEYLIAGTSSTCGLSKP